MVCFYLKTKNIPRCNKGGKETCTIPGGHVVHPSAPIDEMLENVPTAHGT